ncbi:hypothetical protein B0T16DRAFT_417404 [Cercophora newfieldiana]|uniref:Uncharacterized protein n=1 Tax=Cercophora newfieldiana TaxID=92897 RepID=A0AA39Y3L9_9PEZI|nr:hypothetical protein B0T16DRAFT_417404 [Cercophora newfieldiana]
MLGPACQLLIGLTSRPFARRPSMSAMPGPDTVSTSCGLRSTRKNFNLQSAAAEPTKTAPKTRIKTKGLPAEKHVAQQADETNHIQPTHAPIRVGARALKVFRTLFYNPEVTSSPGEVPWQDFLTSTGLFAAEKLYGSVWQFQRLDEESQSKIQFHQPHPRGKISFTMARRYGRRLT